MEYFREELFPCVSLTAVQTDKFKTGCMTAYLLTQLHRETAAENAVLPYVLRRGTKSLPDMRRISERLDALYGAEIEPSVRKLGEIQAVGFYAGFAEDAFLPGETDVLGEVISLLSELWLSPATRGGLFLPAYVDSEREQLVERIERVKNDKRSWAFRRLRENMCAYEDYATGAYGTADEAGSIHYVKLTKHYKELLAVSPMEIFYCGSRPGKEVAAMLREAFALLPRGEIDLDLGTDIRMNAVEEKPRYFTEEDEISPGRARPSASGSASAWTIPTRRSSPCSTPCTARASPQSSFRMSARSSHSAITPFRAPIRSRASWRCSPASRSINTTKP